jgi:carboxymethylenebutenolidase
MCDERTEKEIEEYLSTKSDLSRRQLGKAAAGVALTMMLPSVVNAQALTESSVEITTPDGVADSYFVHPATGQHAGILLWTDIVGLRPVFQMMARRLAESGYSVLVPNPYYRDARAPVVEEGASFQDSAVRDRVFSLRDTLSSQTDFTDAEAFIGFLDAQPSVDNNRKIGTTGYCMGGSMVMRTVGSNPRVGAGASFHGVDLATDSQDSPHLLIPQMDASMLICIASNDDEKEPDVKNILRDSFAAADVPAEIEVYDALHGWCRPEGPAYHEAQAERAWSRLLNLFQNALA